MAASSNSIAILASPDSEANWPILVRVSSATEPVLQATSTLCLAIPVSVSASYGFISTIFDCPSLEIIAGSKSFINDKF